MSFSVLHLFKGDAYLEGQENQVTFESVALTLLASLCFFVGICRRYGENMNAIEHRYLSRGEDAHALFKQKLAEADSKTIWGEMFSPG